MWSTSVSSLLHSADSTTELYSRALLPSLWPSIWPVDVDAPSTISRDHPPLRGSLVGFSPSFQDSLLISILSGHMLRLILPADYGDYEFNWQRLYGPVYRVKGCFGDRLVVSDPVALKYGLNSPIFEHGPSLANAMNLLFEEKCLMAAKGKVSFQLILHTEETCAVGETHKRLRGSMQIGFTASAVRSYQALFESIAWAVTEQLDDFPASPADIFSHPQCGDVERNRLGVRRRLFRTLAAAQSAIHIFADTIIVRLPKWVSRAAMRLPTPTFNIIHSAKRFVKEVDERSIQEKVDSVQQGSAVEAEVFDILCESQSDRMIQLELTMFSPAAYESAHLIQPVQETLRLYPAAPLQECVATRDTTIPLGNSIVTSTREMMNKVMLPISESHGDSSRSGVRMHKSSNCPTGWTEPHIMDLNGAEGALLQSQIVIPDHALHSGSSWTHAPRQGFPGKAVPSYGKLRARLPRTTSRHLPPDALRLLNASHPKALRCIYSANCSRGRTLDGLAGGHIRRDIETRLKVG
ncbi:hypothetical protein B0H14DRAFT_3165597 [Mycena olivaceomarginata]|nr:hypothetical protein B0H14DRAFT_3165597 [Mycena olivaceomarginata]